MARTALVSVLCSALVGFAGSAAAAAAPALNLSSVAASAGSAVGSMARVSLQLPWSSFGSTVAHGAGQC